MTSHTSDAQARRDGAPPRAEAPPKAPDLQQALRDHPAVAGGLLAALLLLLVRTLWRRSRPRRTSRRCSRSGI